MQTYLGRSSCLLLAMQGNEKRTFEWFFLEISKTFTYRLWLVDKIGILLYIFKNETIA